jgi:oligosaccharide reducing-end xylanase
VSSTSAAPAGAFASGRYRDLFAEAGHSKAEVRRKLDATFAQLFHGDSATETVFYWTGSNANGRLAYLSDINNRDVRSEGMSYGMMIAVQMDRKAEFDALWNWSRTYMYNADPRHPAYRFFSWSMKTDGTPNSESPAPDGEEYWVMSLYFASARWGDGHGIYAYRAMADSLLSAMRHRDTISGPWRDAARTSRDFFQKTTNPVTALAPEYANFDGTPVTASFNKASGTFGPDAWRTAANWSVDWAWWAADPRERVLSDRIQAFFDREGIATYGNRYTLDGKRIDTPHSTALVATNAVASLAATDSARARRFVDELWKAPIPSGQYRYYDGMWYLMGLLHCAGEFRIWAPEGER